jgi:hypothetical protein
VMPVVFTPAITMVLVIAGSWYRPCEGLVMLLVSASTLQVKAIVFGVGPVPPPLA